MKIESVPVLVKSIDTEGNVEILKIINMFPVPIMVSVFDNNLCHALTLQSRLAVMINSQLHMLTLLPEREEGQTIYHTFIMKGESNDKPDTPGNDEPPQDPTAVSRPTNGGEQQTSGGNTASNSKEIYH